MPLIQANRSVLLVIDLQGRLMPAIDGAENVVAVSNRLITAASMLEIPILVTEQNPSGLGGTVEDIDTSRATVISKTTFDASCEAALVSALPKEAQILALGCETHVCVLQTVLGLRNKGYQVAAIADACGSRTVENRQAGVRRMAAHGVDIVTSEMVLFEWMGSSDHPKFRNVLKLIK